MNVNMKTIEKTLTYIFIVVIFFILMLFVFDTIQVCVTHGRDYMFSENESWNRKNLFNYVVTDVIYLVVLGLFSLIGIMKLTYKKKLWNMLFYIFLLSLFSFIIYGYYSWAATGFDH